MNDVTVYPSAEGLVVSCEVVYVEAMYHPEVLDCADRDEYEYVINTYCFYVGELH